MRLCPALIAAIALVACKGTPTPTDPPAADCENDETTVDLQTVQVPDWPAGIEDAIDAYREIDGRWTAEACSTPIQVTIRTGGDEATAFQVITDPLPDGNTCGCTHDPDYPNDGELDPVARTTIDITFQDYPQEGFREEAAGNIVDMPVAIYGPSAGDLHMRGCALKLVPPILLSDYTDTEVTFRVVPSGPSARVSLVGPDVEPSSCSVTNWVRIGDND